MTARKKRVLIYLIGIFVFALGVAFAIKSDLGVSPVSSLPYVVGLITGYTVGTMTILLYCLFVLAQWFLLKEVFKASDLLQLVFALAFGSCVDIANLMIRSMPADNLYIQLFYLVFGTGLISLGIFMILKTKLTVSPTDGLVKAIAYRYHIDFPKVKIGVDVSAALLVFAVSLIFLGTVKGVGIGTLLAAFGVGSFIQLFEKLLGKGFLALEEVHDV